MIDSEVLEVRVGDVHVTPEQVADANIGTFGPEDYVLSTGRKLEAQVVTNNSVRVFDGVMVYGGIRDVISVNKYYDIQIDNGAQGMNRNDIIVRHFAITDEVTKRGGAAFRVIKGTPSEGEPVDPEIDATDLRAGALTHDMVLHRVRIEGLNIVAVEPMYDVLYNAAELKDEVDELNRNFSNALGVLTNIKGIYVGSKISACNQTYALLHDNASLTKILGKAPTTNNFVCMVMNGDANAAQTSYYSPRYYSGDGLYVYVYPNVTGNIRVNYVIFAME